MHVKKLIGTKCYLSPIDARDTRILTEWLNDVEIRINLQLDCGVISLENGEMFLNTVPRDNSYSIIDVENEELIGKCGFFAIDRLNQTAEVGIFIANENYWNRGYGTETLSLLVDYGFKELHFNNIMLKTCEHNQEAIKSYEKIGFKQIGIRREALYMHLEKYNIVYMDILTGDYEKLNRA